MIHRHDKFDVTAFGQLGVLMEVPLVTFIEQSEKSNELGHERKEAIFLKDK